MKKTLLSACLLAATYGFSQNTCEDALVVAAGMHTVDVVDGDVPTPICSSGGNVASGGEWYAYTAPADYNVTISSSFIENIEPDEVDTRLQVYSGDCGSLQCLDGDDDGGMGRTSEVTVPVLAGTTIYIGWDDAYSEEGFIFEISESVYIAPIIPPVTFTGVNVDGPGTSRGIVDMNGDFLDDIVRVSQNTGIHINYQDEDGNLNHVAIGNETAQYYPSWSMCAGDLDANGYNDLVFGAGSGVSFMFANEDGTGYNESYTTEYVFSQRGNCIDINNDGNLDAFMCHDVQPNVYYINDGDGNLTFNQGGLGDVDGGNYATTWVDYDLDGDTDMFISKCSGGSSPHKQNELWRNNGDDTFTEVSVELDLHDPIQTWSSAWGDFDNDGDMDIFIGVSSYSDGGHKLLENDGEGNFTDVTVGSGFEGFPGTGIENVTYDFDNDGYLDILGLGGAFFFNNGDMTFSESEIDVTNGAVGDVNNDGFLDVLNDGQVHVSNGNDNNWLKLNTIGTVSNLNGIAAMAHVYLPNGQMLTRQLFSGDGFRYMSSLNMHFGLGTQTAIDSVVIDWPSGIHNVYDDVDVNTVYTATEDESVSTGIDDLVEMNFMVYPNPAADVLYLDMPGDYQSMTYRMFDISGKKVAEGSVAKNQINISNLQTGTYVISITVDGRDIEKTIIKQ